jgi:phage-related minor tail protein
MAEDVTVAVRADTAPFQAALENLERLADGFGAKLSGALKGAVGSGRELDDTLRRLALSMAGMALNQGLKPLENLAGSLVGKLAGSALAGAGVPVVPFASGGVVRSPAFFPASGSLGLAGEAGPEAIMPLRRGPDGRLGVASGDESAGRAVQVVFHVTAADAASFRKSEAQITGMLARAVSRGARRS